jgi:glyoxylase-like metal-dependent hydrolase (beta-lactamase superfamily II)
MRRPLLLLALLLPLLASAAQILADGVRLVPGSLLPGRQPDGNTVLFDGPAGTLAVDAGRHVEHTQALLEAAGPRGPTAVLVTHWHLDHLGGVALIRSQRPGVRVFGSDAIAPALTGWLADSKRELTAMLAEKPDAALERMIRIDLALIDAGDRLRPDETIAAPRTLELIGRPLRVGVEPKAVTEADLWVFDPASGVLAVGDLVTLPVPFLDTACAQNWSAALARLEALPATRIVPGHGPALDRAGFAAWRRAFDGLLACAAGTAPGASCADGWVTALGPLLPAERHAGTRRWVQQYLDDVLRAPTERRDRYCQ